MKHIEKALAQYWGFKSFLPLQREAMECISSGTDSVVVLPTGGGKSLCFQAPAVTMPGLAIIVSPLISLMKDQVDALRECGVAAERIDSSLSPARQDEVFAQIRENRLKLLYLSPERLVSDGFLRVLQDTKLSFIAIDEAHCVSMWGHDFRPEYRKLGMLKELLGDITIAAYTATATEHVRTDIAEQLKLSNPTMLTGSFDRPNLVYKVKPRNNIIKQVCSVVDQHKGSSGIIYCIRRKDVDKELFETLRKLRSKIARKKKIPAYIVFGDVRLRDMARKKPLSIDTFLDIKGVGQKKCNQYAQQFISAIKDYCQQNIHAHKH